VTRVRSRRARALLRALVPRGALPPLLAALAALAGAGRASAASDAPLGVGTPGPFRALFLDLPLVDARAAERRAVDLRWTMANGWSVRTALERRGRTVVLQGDAQTDALQLSVEVPWRGLSGAPLARAVSTTVEVRLVEQWGGWSDRPIEAWHHLIRSWNFQRELHPRDRVALELVEPGGARLADLSSSRLAIGDVALRSRVVLLERTGHEGGPAGALALRLDLKLPTGPLARLAGSGGVDAGLGLAATLAPWPWLTAHAQLAVRIVSPLPRAFPLQPNRLQGGADLSLVARIGPRVALVVEDRILTPLFEDGWRIAGTVEEPEATAWYSLFRPHNQVSGGVRIDDLTAFLSEDFTPGRRLPTDPGPRWFYDSNAPDLVLGISWAKAW
jgi:hypothetical protein